LKEKKVPPWKKNENRSAATKVGSFGLSTDGN